MPFVPVATTPAKWFVCFHRGSPTWWVRRFLPGRWKHVNAFGMCPGQDTWVFFDFALDGAGIAIVPDRQRAMVDRYMEYFMADARVYEFTPSPARRRFWQPISLCVSETASIVGSESRALRARRFMRDLIAEGATVVQWEPDYEGRQRTEAGTGGGGAERGDPH